MLQEFALPPVETIIEHSFLDFHAKGLSYLCLKRSPALTIKLYFFDGDVATLPEVVAPHDHRYNFRTTVFSGCVENRLYMPCRATDADATVYQRFAWMTPLNGGNGFTWLDEKALFVSDSKTFARGESYLLSHEALHTIQIRAPQTILQLEQFDDRVPLKRPTSTYTLNREPPSLSGLYRKPTADDVMRLLALTAKAQEGFVAGEEQGFCGNPQKEHP